MYSVTLQNRVNIRNYLYDAAKIPPELSTIINEYLDNVSFTHTMNELVVLFVFFGIGNYRNILLHLRNKSNLKTYYS
jgi:hypothetical protein